MILKIVPTLSSFLHTKRLHYRSKDNLFQTNGYILEGKLKGWNPILKYDSKGQYIILVCLRDNYSGLDNGNGRVFFTSDFDYHVDVVCK